MSKSKTKKKPERRFCLSNETKQLMFGIILRNPELFARYKDAIQAEQTRTIITGGDIVWLCAKNFYNRYQELPDHTQLAAEVRQSITERPTWINDADVEILDDFLDSIYKTSEDGRDVRTDKTMADMAVRYFKRWQEDLVAHQLQKDIVLGNTVHIDLHEKLRVHTQNIERLASYGSETVPAVFGDDWMERPRPVLTSTGIVAANYFLGGGHCGGEVYLFMAPYGSCKTLAAVQMCHHAAIQANKAWSSNPDGLIPVSAYVSYEMPRHDFQDRLLMIGAKIPRSRLKELTDLRELRTGGDLIKYERFAFKELLEKGEKVIPEMERANQLKDVINRHVMFFDLSRNDPNDQAKGIGGMREVQQTLLAATRANPRIRICALFIDHLMAMAANEVGGGGSAGGLEWERVRPILQDAPKQARDFIAAPFDCPVWCLHQLAGAKNKLRPTEAPHHTDSAESRSVAMFVDFAIQSGPITKDKRQLAVWACTKYRREPPNHNRIVRVKGNYGRVVDVSKSYVISGNNFQTTDEAHSVVNANEQISQEPTAQQQHRARSHGSDV